ncbi:MAG: SidE phosphodiesterase domain-containing protein [Legionella sp.]|uniref:SidE phosphodiesterase domain-containing protein n=1 Tax=Legionella sp. TaxID=459 RepID=UPI002840F0CE|nr:SidE phosphodiesterase domain-containing protein [Legionella sp.]
MVGKKNPSVVLPIKSSTLGRRMEVDLEPLQDFKHFWQDGEGDQSNIWQVLADNYINKPYLDVPALFRGYIDITHDNFTVHHRNHDTTHAVRQRLYAQNYLDLIQNYGNEEYAPIATEINNNNELKACLELAIYLCRSGRTNEKSGKDDPSNAKRSAELFAVVATEMGFDPDLVNFLKFAIGTHAPKLENHQDLVEKLPGEHKLALAHLLKGVIDLSHHTDLVRCKVGPPKEPVREQIDEELGEFLDPKKIDVERATTNFLVHATQLCKMTGTRVKFETFSQQDKENNAKLKVQHARDVSASMEQLRGVKLDPHRIIHEGPQGDFAEFLRQVSLTGVLDLTNKQINTVQLEQIKKCIAENPIKKACLLGVKPMDAQRDLVAVLKEKSVTQGLPIEMNHTEFLEQELVGDFDSQFRQQAIDRQKVSMRFEPSRLGAAYAKGWGAFFSQLWKEIKGDVPTFGGDTHYTQITEVKKLSNPALEARYDALKKPVDPISGILSKELQTIQTDDIQLEPGEMLLYHGTNSDVSPLIMQNGFDEGRCKYVKGNGYGPLGQGVYFTSELSKAATFSTCTECKQSGMCSCVKKGTDQPADRVVLVCKVFVGNPEIVLKKGGLQDRTRPQEPFDSYMALSKDIDPISQFRSTEVCVPSGKQIIPLYEIRFSSQPNLLKASTWEKTIEENGLKERTGLYEIKASVILLNQLQALRDIPAPFEVVKKQAHKVETVIQGAINKLERHERVLQAKTPREQGRLDKIAVQLRDLHNLKGQLSTLQKQEVDLKPTLEQETMQGHKGPGFLQRVLRFILPKNYALKREGAALATEINNNAGNPKDFQSGMIQWLNLAIERNQHKASNGDVSHRAVITQKLIHLRDALRDLEEKNLNDEDLSKEIHRLITDTLDGFKSYANLVPMVMNSTAYKSLSSFQETASTIVGETFTTVHSALRGLAVSKNTESEPELELGAQNSAEPIPLEPEQDVDLSKALESGTGSKFETPNEDEDFVLIDGEEQHNSPTLSH